MLKIEKLEGKTSSTPFFDKLVWLNSEEAAQYLRKSVGAIRVLVCRGNLYPRKWNGRLYFKKIELDQMLENSYKQGEFL